jgi:tripartite ATP-independent transporter DctP family solute receptor
MGREGQELASTVNRRQVLRVGVSASLGLAALPVLELLEACAGVQSRDTASGNKTFNLRVGNLGKEADLGPGDILKSIVSEAKDRSGGHLVIQPFYNASLGDEDQMLANLRVGGLEMAITTNAAVAGLVPAFNITELPYFWHDESSLRKLVIEDGAIGKDLFKQLLPTGIKGLSFIEYGFRQVISRRPVAAPGDFKGMKVRVLPNQLYVDTWAAFGSTPASIAYSEVYTALQTGTVDAADTNPMGMVTPKWYEAAHYLIVTNHIFSTAVLMINNDKWNSLGSANQQIILDGIKKGRPSNEQRARQVNDDAISTMQKAGNLQVQQIDAAPFRAQASGIWKKWSSRIGPQLIDQAQKAQGG